MNATVLHITLDSITKHIPPIQHIICGGILIMLAVFSSNIPLACRVMLDSTIGRLIAISLIIIIFHFNGWIYGILVALAVLLILSGIPESNVYEQFEQQKTKDVTGNNKWYIEKALSENPEKIVTDTARNSETQITHDTIGNKWINERILKEIPTKISTDTIITPSNADYSSQRNVVAI